MAQYEIELNCATRVKSDEVTAWREGYIFIHGMLRFFLVNLRNVTDTLTASTATV